MKIRKAAFSGKFYPNNAKDLKNLIEKILIKEKNNIALKYASENFIGGIVPHAGYVYSAYQAVHFFKIAQEAGRKFQTIIILNPNHTGYGADISLDENDAWNSPLGDLMIDSEFYALLPFDKSEISHKYEHSGEVMLPLLQYFLGSEIQIVPITIMKQSYENSKKIAQAIFQANAQLKKEILIIASSDFTHFESPEKRKTLDDYVINNIFQFNTQGVYSEVKSRNISVCGYGPIMTLMEYAKMVFNIPQCVMLKRGHSGEVHQSSEVVNYISMLFFENKATKI